MAEDTVRLEKRVADLQTPYRQRAVQVFGDWYTSNYDCLGFIRSINVFTDDESDSNRKASVLDRTSYIDDILTLAATWESLYGKVERLLEVCNKWNLLISLTKCFLGRRKWIT